MRTFITVLIFCLIPVEAFAYDNKEVIKHKGKQGVFVDEETFTRITQDLAEYQILKSRKIPELQNKINELQSTVNLLEKELKVTEAISQRWKDSYLLEVDLRVKETTRLRELLAKKGAWYKAPPLMFTLGIVGGGLLSVGLAWGINNATDKEVWNL